MKRIFLITTIAVAVMAVTSCNKYDGYALSEAVRHNSEIMPPKSVADMMPADKLQIPDGARDVEWEREGPYWVLNYDLGRGVDKKEVEVYFDTDGSWVMTRTDLHINDVPQYIKNYISSSSEYAGARISDRDAEYVETPDGNSYFLELMIDRFEVDVEVTEDGVITERHER
jgi:hypothetical protein